MQEPKNTANKSFIPGHSTESALILMTEKWLKATNEEKLIGAVMVDVKNDLIDITYY